MIAGILLAAGLARRMGRPKLLLILQGKAIVRWSAEGLVRHLADVVVVTGGDDAAIRDALADLPVRFAVNPRPPEGQASSIATGVAALQPWTRAVVIALGDQPRVPDAVVPALVEAFQRGGKAIVAPLYRGVQGTPVLFGVELFAELAALRGDTGARALLRAHADRLALVPFDHPAPPDVDTPEDYARLHVQ